MVYIVMRNDFNEPIYCTTHEAAVRYIETVLIPKIKQSCWEWQNAKFSRRDDRWWLPGSMCYIRIEEVKHFA